MGEHSKPDPEYELPDYRLRSQTPELNLPERSTGAIHDMLSEVHAADVQDEESGLQGNQLSWEMDLLVDQNPDHAKALIESLMASDDEWERMAATTMVIKLCNHDAHRDWATESMIRLLEDESYEVRGHVPEMLDAAVKNGGMDLRTAGSLISDFSMRISDRAEVMRDLKSQRDRTLGQAATGAKQGIHIAHHNGDVVVAKDGLRINQRYDYE
ncbi:DNA alkylation repair protein [Nocardia bovistercoris]|uniref:Uncharacterized protein n=1 Tax=Nocardia bovistercoris TaxID=2785916 RepID=A0A931IG44_9NOCA|nr:hypothetical protein [Nocardia bovistercoris]MBH0779938.1 hypothetical protein [Nocardia bovistercoris]